LAEQNPQKNKYLSKSLANLAELYDEAGKSEMAIKYYKQSMKIDEDTKNYNGLYSTSRHLAEIYSGNDSEQSLKYLEAANLYAKKLKEPYYMADITYEIGNYYLLRKDFYNSIKYLNDAYAIAKTSLSKEDVERINAKLEYVKKHL
jgi:tetratricopeptide (TPR) repeat protein